jgi:hypothetical protein
LSRTPGDESSRVQNRLLLIESHEQQNDPEIKYYLEPFCGLFKPYKALVRSLDTVWNQFEANMYAMYEKLARLDFVIIKGDVAYIPREEVRNVWL